MYINARREYTIKQLYEIFKDTGMSAYYIRTYFIYSEDTKTYRLDMRKVPEQYLCYY